MIRVTAPSRLHFGLFRLPTEQDDKTDATADVLLPARQFGGVGLMIDKPGVQISLTEAQAWSASGPSAERALAYAHLFLRNCPELEPRAFSIFVDHCAPEHAGLGTGTQLGLAVAKALAVALGKPDWDAATLAGRVERGRRSAVGVHGFQHGGLLVDGGKGATTILAPLIARHDFPDDWAILLILPTDRQGAHGPRECEAFTRLSKENTAGRHTDGLCRLVVLGLLPALVEHDLPAFGEALYEFNRRVGEMFKPWQGGIYSDARTESLVKLLKSNGVHGIGQSSWGPAVFAVHGSDRDAEFVALVQKRLGLAQGEIHSCRAADHGACLTSQTARLRS
jgi:beta-RFAP synthase